ncbi:MAG: hypothetical protein IPJ07_12995 [Acidobacteria bacterium]|nr:hypothetical protein [Acidobacteriota bacterium]
MDKENPDASRGGRQVLADKSLNKPVKQAVDNCGLVAGKLSLNPQSPTAMFPLEIIPWD